MWSSIEKINGRYFGIGEVMRLWNTDKDVIWESPEVIIPGNTIQSLRDMSKDEILETLEKLHRGAQVQNLIQHYGEVEVEFEHTYLAEDTDLLEKRINECHNALGYADVLSDWARDEINKYIGILQFKYSEASKKKEKRLERIEKEERKKQSIGYIYIIRSEHGYKIGKTKNYTDRMKIFGVKLPFEWSVHRIYQLNNYHTVETELHNLYDKNNVNGEWFSLTDDDLGKIDKIIDIQFNGEIVDFA